MNHCARESTFPLSLKNTHPRIARGAGPANFSGTVSAAVINDDELAIYVRVYDCGAEPFQKIRNVSCFVEGRNYQA
jgi:hypothetical protein